MIEKQPFHKHKFGSPIGTYSLLGCFSILFLIILTPNVFATTSSDVIIKTPVINQQFTTTSILVSGTFTSPYNPPTITIYTDQGSYGATINSISQIGDGYTGTWSGTVSDSNGWHTVKATISDPYSPTTDSTQFYVNDGTGIISQVKYKEIPIEYSQACLAMINVGDYSSCPPMEKLVPIDKSNQHISGHFVQGKYGIVREKPQMKGAEQFYQNYTPCVECLIDGNADSQMQIIWLVPHVFPYTVHDFTSYTTNDTIGSPTYHISTVNEQNAGLTVYHDKYVDDSCMSAQVVFKNIDTINATLKYLEGGCTDKSYFNTTQTIIPNTPWSYDNPGSSLHYDSYLKQIFNGHKFFSSYNATNGGGLGPKNCITEKCSFTDPYKKAGY